MVFRPHAWPLARAAWVQVTSGQSRARTSQVSGLHCSTRLPPVDVQEERLLDGVLVRPGLDEHALGTG